MHEKIAGVKIYNRKNKKKKSDPFNYNQYKLLAHKLKYRDILWEEGPYSVDPEGENQWLHLNAIYSGSGSSNRIGRLITVRRIDIQISCCGFYSLTADLVHPSRARMILAVDSSPSNATGSYMYGYDGLLSERPEENAAVIYQLGANYNSHALYKFQVMRDYFTNQVTLRENSMWSQTISIDCCIECVYTNDNTSAGDGLINMSKNAILFGILARNGAYKPGVEDSPWFNFNVYSRLLFHDN